MKKTNFTFIKSLVLLVMLAFGANANAQGTVACQDHVNVSLSSTCTVALTPATFSAGAPGTDIQIFRSDMTTAVSAKATAINLTFTSGSALPANAANAAAGLVSSVNIGTSYVVRVYNGTNSCWGTVLFEDKLAPTITCPKNDTIQCGVTPPAFAATASDCSAVTITSFDNVTTFQCPVPMPVGDYIKSTIVRTFTATDAYGNTATCVATRSIQRKKFVATGLAVVAKSYDCDEVFPKDAAGNPSPSGNNGSGFPVYSGGNATLECDFMVNYADVKVATCGNGYKVIRTWTILDWCTGLSGTTTQIIKVEDQKKPSFTGVIANTFITPGLSLSTSAIDCNVNATIAFPAATDNCDASLDNSVKVWTATATAPTTPLVVIQSFTATSTFNLAGLPVGNYVLQYFAKDDCGNTEFVLQALEIADLVPPVAVCRQDTKVSLTLDGTATVAAVSFDEGSTDNCCFDANSHLVRRVGTTTYAKSVKFDCNDCGKTVMVEMQVADCSAAKNTNSCMISVTVDEKLPPVIHAQGTMFICSNNADATAWLNANKPQLKTIISYPTPSNPGYYDNCPGATTTFSDVAGINNCGNGNAGLPTTGAIAIPGSNLTLKTGSVIRNWTVTDKTGRTATTFQSVMSVNMSAYEVQFPADKEYFCDAQGSTEPSATGAPIVTPKGGSCPLVGVEYVDQTFEVVPGACYKILRTWKILNWCQLDNSVTINNGLDPDRGTACIAARTYSNVDPSTVAASKATTFNASFKQFFQTEATKVVASVCNGYDDDGYMEYTQVIKVIDVVAPVLTPGTVTIKDNGKECSSVVTIANGTATDCTKAPVVTYEVFKKGAAGTETLVAGANIASRIYSITTEAGDYVVRFKANDKCGNFSTSDVPFTVKDVKKPTPVAYQGLSAEIMPTSGMVMIMANQFDAGSYDNCPGTLKIKIQSPAAKAGDAYDASKAFDFINFDCKGPRTVSLWVGDAAGNWDFTNTFIDLQTNMALAAGITVNACPSAAASIAALISGNLATEAGAKVVDAAVNVAAASYNANNMTSTTGSYSANVPFNTNVSVKAELNVKPLEGVSTADLVLISKHILGNTKFTSPYKMIAADVNGSKSITTADLVELRKLILHINTNFSNNSSWLFVDKAQTLTVANALAQYTTTININNIAANTTADFVAVKVGDLNNSANAAAGRNANTVAFIGEEQAVKAGETVNATFKADTQVEGYQFTMNYDAAALELVTINGADFAVIENGKVTVSSVENTAFNVVFKAKAATTLSNAVKFNSSVLAAEAYTAGMEVNNVEVKFNNAAIANNGFELYQNSPNPFKGATTISFNLPTSGSAKVVISDMTGRVIRSTEVEGVKGYNEVSVSDLNATGVLNYTVETANHTASKKMIIIE